MSQRPSSASKDRSQLKRYFDNQANRYDELSSHLDFQVDDAFKYATTFLSSEFRHISEPRILELGVGTGGFTEQLVTHLPTAKVLGVDLSKAMLAQAADKLSRWTDRLDFQERDFRKQLPGENYDAVVSAMAFQFYGINHARLLRRIHRCLAPGSCFLTVLNVSSENSRNDVHLCNILNEVAAIPQDQKDWLRQARGKSRFCPSPPSWYLGLLRRAGFIDRECIYLRYGVGIL